jgi:ubiquinone/menaquinone biosynthesis C-methylase UbiE
MPSQRPYLPAAGRDIFLPLYDPLTRLMGGEQTLRRLLAQASIEPDHRVLDVGCGTGTLAILIKREHPGVDVIGLDPDPKALARARRKASRAGVSLRFDEGFGDALPFAHASFDRVFSSMMFHHLPGHAKREMLAEVRRVLRRGGRLELVDFAGRARSFLAHVLHGRQPLSAVADDRLLARMREAGFSDARRLADQNTIFGRVAFYQAAG